MTSSHSDLFVVRRCSQVQKQRSGRSLLRRHGIETTIPDDRKMRKHDEKWWTWFVVHWSSFHYSFISLENQPPLVSTETPLRVAWVAVASKAPSFSQELLEPCVSILDVFEFLAVDDAICSGLARAGQLRVWCLRSYSIFRDGTTWQGCHIPNCKSKIICKGLLSCLVASYHSDSSCNVIIEWPGHILMLFRSILLSFGITG